MYDDISWMFSMFFAGWIIGAAAGYFVGYEVSVAPLADVPPPPENYRHLGVEIKQDYDD